MSRSLWELLKDTIWRDDPRGSGWVYLHAGAINRYLERNGCHLRIDGDTGNFEAVSTWDDGTYGRGKTALEALTEACQLFPLFRHEIIPAELWPARSDAA